MRPVDRVERTIKGRPVDRIPVGEILVDPHVCMEALGRSTFSFQTAMEFWKLAGMDLVVLHPANDCAGGAPEFSYGEDLKNIARWRREVGCFVFALVEGGFTRAMHELGWKVFMEGVFRKPSAVRQAISERSLEEMGKGLDCLQRGAQGIIVADDIAYQKSTYLSPSDMRELYFPCLERQVEELRSREVPVFFHSDGNINAVLEDLFKSGINGLHGLEPAAGMDLENLKESFGRHICLMGNVDPVYLQPHSDDEKLLNAVARTVTVGKEGGRYIFGTCSGLYKGLSAAKAVKMYRAARELGCYDRSISSP